MCFMQCSHTHSTRFICSGWPQECLPQRNTHGREALLHCPFHHCPRFTRTNSQSCVQGPLVPYLKIQTVVLNWLGGFVLCWQMSLFVLFPIQIMLIINMYQTGMEHCGLFFVLSSPITPCEPALCDISCLGNEKDVSECACKQKDFSFSRAWLYSYTVLHTSRDSWWFVNVTDFKGP